MSRPRDVGPPVQGRGWSPLSDRDLDRLLDDCAYVVSPACPPGKRGKLTRQLVEAIPDLIHTLRQRNADCWQQPAGLAR